MTIETGPIYGVPLIQSLPLGMNGGMLQQMPSRADLVVIGCGEKGSGQRVVAGYEVLLSHYRANAFRVAELESEVIRLKLELSK